MESSMTTAASAPASATAQPRGLPTAKEHYLSTYEREHASTMRVLRAYPGDKLDLAPHERCSTARTLIWTFVREQAMAERALTTGFDWSEAGGAPPPPPETLEEIVAAFDAKHRRVAELVRGMPDEGLLETIQFFVAPKTLGDVRRFDFLWMLLHDQIHHRGQLTIYLRLAGGKVPSIYGPSADEPWR
jgi:uncharacterized damage-inducible protein DinB